MIYTLPFIAALIGWFTNYLAVKMLFHPKEKKKILFLEIQGIFPKRQDVLAERLGKIVAEELLSFEELKDRLTAPESLNGIKHIIDHKIDEFLKIKFPVYYPRLSLFVSSKVKERFKVQAMQEIDEAIPEVIDKYIDHTEKQVDIEKMVFEKISQFSSEKLEAIMHAILKKELRFIELVGAILGFFIGLVQMVMVMIQF